VVAVASSSQALARGQENAALNGLTNIVWREANAFDVLRELERRPEHFDIMVLDPPAFAKSKQCLVRALATYMEINLPAIRLLANLAVVGVKLWVGFASASLAVLGGAVDSCVDALNNVVALIVIRVAAKEPDEDHPYGHGKFETLGALAIVGFLSITCFELVREAVNHLVSGTHRVDVSNWQLGFLVLTLGVNLLITWYGH